MTDFKKKKELVFFVLGFSPFYFGPSFSKRLILSERKELDLLSEFHEKIILRIFNA